MKKKFFCFHCKQPKEAEILEIKENGNRRKAVAECPDCGSDMYVAIPKDFKINPKPYEEPENLPEIEDIKKKVYYPEEKVETLKEQVAKLQNQIKSEEKKEKEKIETFDEEVKENKDLLKKYNRIVIKRRGWLFWIIYTIVLTILIFGGIGFAGYWCFTGHCQGLIDSIKPQVNNNINISTPPVVVNVYNNYSIDPPATQLNPIININNIMNNTNSS